MSFDPEGLRHIMRRWTTGVTLLTCALGDERHGMTVSSFTSVSLSPPLILVSLETSSATHELISRSGTFAVTILEQSQRALSDRFAGRGDPQPDRFSGANWLTSSLGHPVPTGALASIDCRVMGVHPAGTHTLLVAEVLDGQLLKDGRPLLYFNRSYHQLGD